MLSRRSFIGAAGGAAGAAAIGGAAWATLLSDSVESSLPATTTTTTTTTTSGAAGNGVAAADRILVVLEMAGGNDALNTLVPASGRYRDLRPTLALSESDLAMLDGTNVGLHPALAPLVPFWADGTMAAVAGVGMQQQSRSHFTAMDTWWSAVPGEPTQTGWLGRWLDATLDSERNGVNDPLRAIALGGGSAALVGDRNLATVVRSPENFALRTFPQTDADALIAAFIATAEPLAADPHLAAAQGAIPTAVEAVELLASVSGEDDDGEVFRAGPQRGGSSATSLLQTAAGVIDLGIGTRVITVGISGFDTHADQLDRHSELLTDVGQGIADFFGRLEEDGNADRVLLMTTSEFGRRAAENGSGGTDHGNGGLQFLFGPSVAGGQVTGSLDLDSLVDGDLTAPIDTRAVYQQALNWLGGPAETPLGGEFADLELLTA